MLCCPMPWCAASPGPTTGTRSVPRGVRAFALNATPIPHAGAPTSLAPRTTAFSRRRRSVPFLGAVSRHGRVQGSGEDIVVAGGGMVVFDYGEGIEGERAQVVDAPADAWLAVGVVSG